MGSGLEMGCEGGERVGSELGLDTTGDLLGKHGKGSEISWGPVIGASATFVHAVLLWPSDVGLAGECSRTTPTLRCTLRR